MHRIKRFNQLEDQSILIIVDVQKSFRKFFTENYLNELKKYCKKFDIVYQLWDNHVDGRNVDLDYLYELEPDIPIHDDLYTFPNQKGLFEKRYNYNVNVDFYKKILALKTYQEIKKLEISNEIRPGDIFKTKLGTYIVYVGNNHKWYHVGKKISKLFNRLSGKRVTIVGGSDNECLQDIYIAAKSFGVDIKRNWKYIYSATHCPI